MDEPGIRAARPPCPAVPILSEVWRWRWRWRWRRRRSSTKELDAGSAACTRASRDPPPPSCGAAPPDTGSRDGTGVGWRWGITLLPRTELGGARLHLWRNKNKTMPTSIPGTKRAGVRWAYLLAKCLKHPDKVRGAAGVEPGHDVPVIRRLVGGWQGWKVGVEGRSDLGACSHEEEAAWRPSGVGVEPAAMV